jgi:Protein of unknown function (DUF3109)
MSHLRQSEKKVVRMQGLVVINLAEARYDCTFGRGCDGVCCKTGRPPVYAEERKHLDAHLHRFLPLLRPEAQTAIRRHGYLMRRRRQGQPLLRRAGGWCVFFHQGCVLHKVGEAEGNKFKYKPSVCALFPIEQDKHDRWYIRQKGYKGEAWDLFCLDPANNPKRAVDTLRDELALAKSFQDAVHAAARLEASAGPIENSATRTC